MFCINDTLVVGLKSMVSWVPENKYTLRNNTELPRAGAGDWPTLECDLNHTTLITYNGQFSYTVMVTRNGAGPRPSNQNRV